MLPLHCIQVSIYLIIYNFDLLTQSDYYGRVWIEDGDNDYIYHSEHILVHKKERGQNKQLEVTIPIREPLPSQYFVRVVSDRWVGCDKLFW